MTAEEKLKAFRTGDGSHEAIALRLRCARRAAGFVKQKQLADALGVSKTTYGHQEKQGKPPISTIRYLYLNHRIDFNFILNGDFAQLPGDVIASLETALHAEGLLED